MPEFNGKLGTAWVEIKGDMKPFEKSVKQTHQKVDRFGKAAERDFKSIGRNITRSLKPAAVAIAGIGAAVTAMAAAASALAVKTTKDYAKFGFEAAKVSTMVKTNVEENMRVLSAGVRQLSLDIPQTTGMLNESLYEILSASVPVSESMFVLGRSGEAAVAGFSDVVTAANLATGTANALNIAFTDVDRIFDIAFSTVREGKVTFSTLAGAMGQLLPSAAKMQASIEEVYGSIAFLTKNAMNADMASVSLARAFDALAQNADKLKDMGIRVFGEEGEYRGLVTIMGEIHNKMRDMNQEAKVNLFEQMGFEIRAARAIVLMSENLDSFRETLDDVANSAGATTEAYNKMKDNLVNQWKLLQNAVKNLSIEIGSSFADAASSALKSITDFINKTTALIQAGGGFSKMWEQHGDMVIDVFAGVARTGLVITKEMFAAMADMAKAYVAQLYIDFELASRQGLKVPFQYMKEFIETTLKEGIDKIPGAFDELQEEMDRSMEEMREMYDMPGAMAERFTQRLAIITRAAKKEVEKVITGLDAAYQEVTGLSPEVAVSFDGLSKSVRLTQDAVIELEPYIEELSIASADLGKAKIALKKNTDELQESFGLVGKRMGVSKEEYDNLQQALKDSGGYVTASMLLAELKTKTDDAAKAGKAIGESMAETGSTGKSALTELTAAETAFFLHTKGSREKLAELEIEDIKKVKEAYQEHYEDVVRAVDDAYNQMRLSQLEYLRQTIETEEDRMRLEGIPEETLAQKRVAAYGAYFSDILDMAGESVDAQKADMDELWLAERQKLQHQLGFSKETILELQRAWYSGWYAWREEHEKALQERMAEYAIAGEKEFAQAQARSRDQMKTSQEELKAFMEQVEEYKQMFLMPELEKIEFLTGEDAQRIDDVREAFSKLWTIVEKFMVQEIKIAPADIDIAKEDFFAPLQKKLDILSRQKWFKFDLNLDFDISAPLVDPTPTWKAAFAGITALSEGYIEKLIAIRQRDESDILSYLASVGGSYEAQKKLIQREYDEMVALADKYGWDIIELEKTLNKSLRNLRLDRYQNALYDAEHFTDALSDLTDLLIGDIEYAEVGWAEDIARIRESSSQKVMTDEEKRRKEELGLLDDFYNSLRDEDELRREQVEADYEELLKLHEKYGRDTQWLTKWREDELEAIEKKKWQDRLDAFKDFTGKLITNAENIRTVFDTLVDTWRLAVKGLDKLLELMNRIPDATPAGIGGPAGIQEEVSGAGAAALGGFAKFGVAAGAVYMGKEIYEGQKTQAHGLNEATLALLEVTQSYGAIREMLRGLKKKYGETAFSYLTQETWEKYGIDELAKGGIARQPTVAVIGEQFKPEAVVPLPDGRSIPVTFPQLDRFLPSVKRPIISHPVQQTSTRQYRHVTIEKMELNLIAEFPNANLATMTQSEFRRIAKQQWEPGLDEWVTMGVFNRLNR